MKCSECGEVVEMCVNCGKEFAKGDSIICMSGIEDGSVMFGEPLHFCSEECLAEYLVASAVWIESEVE